jgi:predicted O-methyltransferase YrrM
MASGGPSLTDEDFVDRCYRYYLGRTADAGGRAHYLTRLRDGASRREVAREFASSDEHLEGISSVGPLQDQCLSPFLASARPGEPESPFPARGDVTTDYDRLALRRLDGLDLSSERMLALLGEFRRYYDALPFRGSEPGDCRFFYANGSFNHFDAVILYCVLRHFAPRHIVEVGSGWSSALMLDVRDRHLGHDTHLTFVDPDPTRLHQLLRADDVARCTIVERRVQDVDPALFEALGAGDVLFIDSSHVVRFGNDVVHLMACVLPRLAPGVLVHVHDIFWNFDYPREWLAAGRAYGEAYLVRAFLTFNPAFDVLLFNDYLARFHWDYLCEHLPLCTTPAPGSPFRNAGVSLWLRRTG